MGLLNRFKGAGLFGLLIVTLCGLPFLLVGLYELYKAGREQSSFVQTRGTVVANSYSTTNENGNEAGAYRPVVRFKTEAGEERRFTDGVGSLPADYAVGEEVEVLYDPTDASRARVKSWKRLWLAPTILTTVGALPFAAVILIIWLLGGKTRRA